MDSTKGNILYPAAKGFISLFMLFTAYFSYTHTDGLKALGFPGYFRIEPVAAKIIGAALLLIPQVSLRVKDWIYAGFVITMISALIAHIGSHDPLSKILLVSFDSLLVITCIQYGIKKEKHFMKEAS
jgi:putative oxidoreductase